MFGTTIGSNSIGSQIPSQMKQVSPKPKKKQVDRYHDYLADYGGCGHWRMIWPQLMINSTQKMIGSNTSAMIIDDSFYKDLTCVRVQRQVTPGQLQFMKLLRQKADRLGFKIVYEVDDIFVLKDIPKYNAFRAAYDNDKLQKSAIEILKLADVVTVPSKPMQQYYSKYNKNTILLENYPPKFWLDGYYDINNNITSLTTATRPKVMYSGSTAHFDVKNLNKGVDDFSHVEDLVKKTTDKFEWIFIGACPPGLRPLVRSGKITMHDWCNIYQLPAFIHKLNIHAFIAPLNNNIFNECKSDIKIVEAGAHGVPCICQDIVTYKQSPLKFSTGDDLHDQLNKIFDDVDLYEKLSRQYHNITSKRWLDDNYHKHIKLFSK